MNLGASAPRQRLAIQALTFPGRNQSFALAGIVCTLNARFSLMLQAVRHDGTWGGAADLFGVSAVVWFALYALWMLGAEGHGHVRPVPGDRLVLGAMFGAALMPLQVAGAAAVPLGAVWLWRSSAPGSDARRIALILAALAGHLLAAPLVLAVAARPFLELDGAFVGWIAGTPVHGNLVDFAGVGRFVVAGGCSSFHNMSLGVLCWATLIQLFKLRIDARLVGYLALVLAGLFAVNGARLAAIALHPRQFVLYHEGWVAGLFGWAGLVIVALICGLGVLDAARRQA